MIKLAQAAPDQRVAQYEGQRLHNSTRPAQATEDRRQPSHSIQDEIGLIDPRKGVNPRKGVRRRIDDFRLLTPFPDSKPLDADTAVCRRWRRCSTLTRQIDTDR